MNWISVKDRLPEPNTSVIVWVDFGGGFFCESYYSVKSGEFKEPYLGQEIDYPITNVTHWAIPEPPKPIGSC